MKIPSYVSIGNFINNNLKGTIEEIFAGINEYIFEADDVDLNHVYIDGSKIEANANKYTWVWKKSCIKSRNKLFTKITDLLGIINHLNQYRPVNFRTDNDGNMICPAGKRFFYLKKEHVKGNQYGRTQEYYQCENCEGCLTIPILISKIKAKTTPPVCEEDRGCSHGLCELYLCRLCLEYVSYEVVDVSVDTVVAVVAAVYVVINVRNTVLFEVVVVVLRVVVNNCIVAACCDEYE